MSKQPIEVSAPDSPDSEEPAETLPYIYRTFDESTGAGAEIVIRSNSISVGMLDHLGRDMGRPSTSPLPTGTDAVELTHAVLAATGDTKYRVVSEEEVTAGRLVVMRIAAEAMRDQIAEWLEAHGHGRAAAEQIRALPLLPDGYEVPSAPEPLTSPAASAYQSKIEALRSDLDTLQEVVRDLGSALHDHIRATVDHLQQEQIDALASAAEAINRHPFTVNDDH